MANFPKNADAKITSTGELQVKRYATTASFIAMRCPYRYASNATAVSGLFVCDHFCPHWVETIDSDSKTVGVTLTCSGMTAPNFTITLDSRS